MTWFENGPSRGVLDPIPENCDRDSLVPSSGPNRLAVSARRRHVGTNAGRPLTRTNHDGYNVRRREIDIHHPGGDVDAPCRAPLLLLSHELRSCEPQTRDAGSPQCRVPSEPVVEHRLSDSGCGADAGKDRRRHTGRRTVRSSRHVGRTWRRRPPAVATRVPPHNDRRRPAEQPTTPDLIAPRRAVHDRTRKVSGHESS